MTSFEKKIYLSAIGAAQDLPKMRCIFEEGTNNRYHLDENKRVVRHNGMTWENSGFPLNDSHVFYSLRPLDK